MDEITAEYEVTELRAPAELKCVPQVTIGCKTDLGRVRDNNEDKFEYYLPSEPSDLAVKGLIFVVCDGMGGHASGQIASELACKTYIDVYLNHPSDSPAAAAQAAVVAANRYVHDVSRTIPGRQGMGTTLSAMMLVQNRAVVAQVGDSRVYRLRNNKLDCITTDHTWIEEALRSGMITPAEAETHPYKHVITRAIGTEAEVKPDIFEFDIETGDTYLLCSDGVMNHVDDPTIERLMCSNSPSSTAWKIVAQALIGGGSDNTTCLVVRVDSIDSV